VCLKNAMPPHGRDNARDATYSGRILCCNSQIEAELITEATYSSKRPVASRSRSYRLVSGNGGNQDSRRSSFRRLASVRQGHPGILSHAGGMFTTNTIVIAIGRRGRGRVDVLPNPMCGYLPTRAASATIR